MNSIKTWDYLKDLYGSLSSELGEIWKKAKEKDVEFMTATKQTISDVYKGVVTSLKGAIEKLYQFGKDKIEEFKKMVESKKDEILEMAKSAEQIADEIIKSIAKRIKAALEKGEDIAKNVGLFTLGLVALPFYGAVILAKKTYEMGEEVAVWLKDGMESIKTNLPIVWQEFKTDFQEG